MSEKSWVIAIALVKARHWMLLPMMVGEAYTSKCSFLDLEPIRK